MSCRAANEGDSSSNLRLEEPGRGNGDDEKLSSPNAGSNDGFCECVDSDLGVAAEGNCCASLLGLESILPAEVLKTRSTRRVDVYMTCVDVFRGRLAEREAKCTEHSRGSVS